MLRSTAHFLGLAGACLVLVASPAHAQEFTVAASHGDAQVGKDPNSYQPAAINSTYQIPSWGKTVGDGSSLTISFNGGNRFRLLPDSEAQVILGDGDTSSAWHRVVSLKIGKAAISHEMGSSPTVKLDCQTPTAVCGAVGTEFEVDATNGQYSVTSGRISVSSDEEGALSLSNIQGGTATYAPGKSNTYAHGSFYGTVRLNGSSYRASDCTFTVAKIRDDSGQTAVHIESGSLGNNGPGDYISNGAGLTRLDPKSVAATIHPQYLLAAQKEGALSVKRASYRAANLDSPVSASDVNSAATEATALREKLFNRETIRETVKQTVQAVTSQAAQGAANAASQAAANAAAQQASQQAAQQAAQQSVRGSLGR